MVYRAGIKHKAADALPRRPTDESHTTPIKNRLPFLAIVTPGSTDPFVPFVDTISNVYSPLDAMYVAADTQHNTIDTPATPTADAFIRKQA